MSIIPTRIDVPQHPLCCMIDNVRATRSHQAEFIVTEGYDMRHRSSLETGGKAEYYAEPRDTEEARSVLELAYRRSLPLTIIGGGTHILVSDEGVEGIVLSTRCMKGISIKGDMLVASPGEMLDNIINIAIEHRLSGLEEIAGIPGTIAGAIAVNANANGRAISDLFLYSDVLTPDGYMHRYPHYLDAFREQSSIIGGTGIVTSVALSLIPSIKTAEARMRKEAFVESMFIPPCRRFSGEIFRNPEGMKAEELLRKAGVPGPTGLRAEFSEYQPNSIFTYQGCTSDEIYTAMLMAKRKVERKLGVKLERSLTLIGSFRDLTL